MEINTTSSEIWVPVRDVIAQLPLGCPWTYGALPHIFVQAPTKFEMVWLKDVTASFETGKEKHDNLDLPDELTFNLISKSNALTLNLKRNRGIDPNADVYVVRKMKDGRPQLEKTLTLEKENLAYYQDRDNGAFMTVRCVKKSKGQCDRVINGNIRLGDKDYDLRLADTDVTSRNVFDVPDLLGTKYVLREQANIQRYVSTESKSDATNVNVKNVEQEFIDLRGHSPREQDKRKHFRLTNSTLSSRNVASSYKRGIIDKNKRNKDTYWIEIAVLIDFSIWDFFVSLVEAREVQTNLVHEIDDQAKRRIKEYFSHIINGVHLRYNKIEDSSIDISVTLREFIMFPLEDDIAFVDSLVKSHEGKTYVDAEKYVNSIGLRDAQFGQNAPHDHAMLFTRHDLYEDSIEKSDTNGRSELFGICVPGKRISVIQSGDYFETVHTATHELGHNLGADHDGDNDTMDCPAEDLFTMSPDMPLFEPGDPFSRNPWVFSNCSVRTFKKTLKLRDCLKNPGLYFDMEEWELFTVQLPGEAYSYSEQCEFINGPYSAFCGVVSADICLDLQCTNPKTGECDPIPFSPARGTECGTEMWCMEGQCVEKNSK